MMVFVSPPLNAQSFRQPTFKTGKPLKVLPWTAGTTVANGQGKTRAELGLLLVAPRTLVSSTPPLLPSIF